MLRQVIDDQVYKLHLICRQRLYSSKRAKRVLCRRSIQSHEGTYEQPQPMRFFCRMAKIVRSADAAFAKHSFELLEIARCQWFVHAQLVNSDVVLVRPQECLCLGTNFA